MKIAFAAVSGAFLCAMLATGHAQTPVASPNLGAEYTRQMNVPPAVGGTHTSRAAERKARRGQLKQLEKSGALASPGEALGMNGNRPPAVSGTHASRQEERKERRAEMSQVVKSGELPVTNEAGVNQPASPR